MEVNTFVFVLIVYFEWRLQKLGVLTPIFRLAFRSMSSEDIPTLVEAENGDDESIDKVPVTIVTGFLGNFVLLVHIW